MNYIKTKDPKYSRIELIAYGQVIGLTLLLVFTFLAGQRNSQENIKKLAETNARTHSQKDSSYRQLFIASGGAYITLGKEILPDETLSHRHDRDIVTRDGKVATLVSPKNLLHLANDLLPADGHGHRIVSVIKTLHPLSQEDTPDEWEAQALRGLQQGRAEVSEVMDRDGRKFLRYMYPVLATRGCLKNRPDNDLKVGDLLGGLSVTVPMDLFDYLRQEHTRHSFYLHFILWLLGVAGIFWSFRKVQKRDAEILAAQKAQRDAYEELEKTFDAIDGIITIQDQDMRITRVNRATCETFNATMADLIGKYCYEVFRGTTKPCEGCPEIKSLQDGILHHSEIEHTNLQKIFAVSAAPIVNDSGETTKLVHYAKDITESRRQEKQLRQAQKMEAVGTLAGGIAHDFNNILTAIIGFSELVLMRSSLNDEIGQDVNQIHQAGLRAKDLVQQILTFSRKGEQDFQPLQVQPVVKEALKLLRASIPATIAFKGDIAEGSALVIADPSQVHQVVMNLCTNAYHAMRDLGGILTVTLKSVELGEEDVREKRGVKPGSYQLLTVADTGKGIKKELHDRIFEPYFTTKEKGDGTGLGLSLVHGIVRSMGGAIAVESEEGQGTTFCVYLPVVSDSEVAKKNEAAWQGRMPIGSERILLVDDEESIITMERRTLESLGYKVTAFYDPLEAREVFMAEPENFDLVISDMNMPHLSGLDLVEFMKGLRPDLPIIISTGFSDQIDTKTAQKYGVTTVMMKPVLLHELAQEVRLALDVFKASKES